MAILHLPRPASAAPEAPVSAAEQRRRDRRRKALEVLPMVLMGVVVAISVGYGMGTLIQFDTDWRSGAPAQVVSQVGAPAAGATLDEAVTAVMSATDTPVSEVTCTVDQPAESLLGDQLCVARTDAGMVSIVVRQDLGLLRVTVFGGH